MSPAEALTVPTQSHGVSLRGGASPSRSKKKWRSKMPLGPTRDRQNPTDDRLGRENSRSSRPSAKSSQDAWWKIRLFAGMYNDIRRRAPFYWSDFRDAWDYRVVPATVYMYFAKYVYIPIHYFLSFRCLRKSELISRNRASTLVLVIHEIEEDLTNMAPVFCPLWPLVWTCSRRRTRVSASTRCSWPLCLHLWSFPWRHANHL